LQIVDTLSTDGIYITCCDIFFLHYENGKTMNVIKKLRKRLFGGKEKPVGKTSIDPLLGLFNADQNLTVAEVGVFRAESSVAMLQRWTIKKFYAVDRWEPYDEYIQKEKSQTTRELSEDNGDQTFELASGRLKPFLGVSIIRADSVTGADSVPDNSLDFCFIDANHEYEFVLGDLKAWYPKVRVGGILSGHDYFYKPVRDAVHCFWEPKKGTINTCGHHHSGNPTCWWVTR